MEVHVTDDYKIDSERLNATVIGLVLIPVQAAHQNGMMPPAVTE